MNKKPIRRIDIFPRTQKGRKLNVKIWRKGESFDNNPELTVLGLYEYDDCFKIKMIDIFNDEIEDVELKNKINAIVRDYFKAYIEKAKEKKDEV